jgi:hypothetical protein
MLESVNGSDSETCERVPATPTYSPTSCTRNQPGDADLRRVAEAWPRLPDVIRTNILMLVQLATKGGA